MQLTELKVLGKKGDGERQRVDLEGLAEAMQYIWCTNLSNISFFLCPVPAVYG